MDDKWLEVSVDTTDAGIEDLSAYLTRFETGGLVIEDEAEFRTFLEQNREYWDYVDEELLERMRGVARIKFYVTDDSHGHEKLSDISAGLGALRQRSGAELGTLEVRTVSLCEEDWANNWKQYYKPLSVGNKLYVVPEWEKGGAIPDGRMPLYLNPGLIFGTGNHASTRMCLEGVEEYVRPGGTVLDLGCGSGILSLAALCLGGREALGVDIDPKAVGVAYENGEMNGIGRTQLTILAGNVLSDHALAARLAERRWNLVLANIVADVIIPLSAQVPALLAEDGVFLCSGIIAPRADEVCAALESRGLRILEKKEQGGWVAFAAGRL